MTTKILKALELGKVNGAKALLAEYYLKEDKDKWLQAKQEEYNVLFPAYRDMTEEEKAEHNSQFTEENPKPVSFDDEGVEIPYVYPQVAIDYSEDENYVTFTDWLNETVVVSEAVEAVTELDAEGFEVIVTPYIPEVTELVRPYVAPDTTDRVNAYIGSKYAELRKAEYPDIGEQLDMQYKDMLDGGTRFKDAIAAVKAKYPKE